jgi:PAS domain S-box-containing protein
MKTKVNQPKENSSQSDDKAWPMLESITDAFFALDQHGNFIYANAKAADILQRPHDYLKGKNIWVEFAKSRKYNFKDAVAKAMATKETVYLDEYHISDDLWFENHIYPFADGVCVYMKDISARKQKEISFNKLAKRNALLLHMMQNSFLLTDSDLNIIDVNPAFCKTMGYSRSELLTMNVHDFDAQLSTEEMKQNFRRAAQ